MIGSEPFAVGSKVWFLIMESGWSSYVYPMTAVVTKIINDEKGLRYRLKCNDRKLRTRTAAALHLPSEMIAYDVPIE